MREPIRDNFCRMAKPISMAASVSFAISLANCFRSDTFEGARAGLGDVDVLILGAIAYADCPDTNVIHLQRQAAAQWQLLAPASDGNAQREHQVHVVAASRRAARQPTNRGAVRFAN